MNDRNNSWMVLQENCGDTHHVHIVNCIRNMIHKGELQTGELLPSERELASKFNVSRVPVREAMKILEFIGVLRRVRSRGLFVSSVDIRLTMNQFDFIFTNVPDALDEVYEFRQAVEVQAAICAARHRTEDDIFNIHTQLVREGQLGQIEHADTKTATGFHWSIAQASHNSLFERTFDFLLELHVATARTNLNSREKLLEAHYEHRMIYECIKNRDHHGAGFAMGIHMENSKRRTEMLFREDE